MGLGNPDCKVVGERLVDVKQDFQWSDSQAKLFKLALRFQAKAFKRDTVEA
jgi:hypothetical protein